MKYCKIECVYIMYRIPHSISMPDYVQQRHDIHSYLSKFAIKLKYDRLTCAICACWSIYQECVFLISDKCVPRAAPICEFGP
jgi:hypothetical protein